MSIKRHGVGKRLSEATVHNGTIYLAGQIADDPKLPVRAQTEQVLGHIDRLLGELGSKRDRILSATIYMADMKDFAEMNAACLAALKTVLASA